MLACKQSGTRLSIATLWIIFFVYSNKLVDRNASLL